MNGNKVVFKLNLDVKSPSFIASADIHLGKKLYNIPELEEDLKDNFVRLCDLAVEKQVNYLVIAGDLFETNDKVRPNIVAFIKHQVERLKVHNISVVGIAGDHDKPVQKESWIHISGIAPVTIEKSFAGIDYFDYSTATVDELINLIKGDRNCNEVLWLFLHCQFPQVFDKAEPKKSIDYNRLRLFENFPNIQGIIAGDLHFAPEIRAYGVGHEAYVGYPGSLGINDRSEYKHDKHVLYCDGKELVHLPFYLPRKHRDIDLRGEMADEFDVEDQLVWVKQQDIKPILFITYDTDSENQLIKIVPLYDYAIIKRNQVAVGSLSTADSASISCRTEVSSADKIQNALHYSCNDDEELFELALSLLKTEDVKIVLDEFKGKYKL